MDSQEKNNSIGSKEQAPQQVISDFWDKFIIKSPSKATSILPRVSYAVSPQSKNAKLAPECHNVSVSYEAAAAECRKTVDAIVRQCQLTNEKFTDPDFDLEIDFSSRKWNYFHGLLTRDSCPSSRRVPKISVDKLRDSLDVILSSGILRQETCFVNLEALQDSLRAKPNASHPAAVHRTHYIFENPSFCVDGYTFSDVRQGRGENCAWLSAVSTICNVEKLVDRVCVKRDEKCGVYGFVFYRDGEWISTVVDDNLYMEWPDFEGDPWDSSGEKERSYKKKYQTGSDALYFARCEDKNETWLPLLEKAFAKVHGDYDALNGGSPGEGVEDLTGGVTTTITLNKVLDQEKLWQQLLQANKEFVFALASPTKDTYAKAIEGITLNHAYAILRATEEADEDGKKVKLVLIRNPWGERDSEGMGEWSGPWSDGSKEWTPYWMTKLNYRFGDDGQFWMSYDDMLKKFVHLDRTHLFDDHWKVIEQWTSVNVSWATSSLNIKFLVELTKPGPVVFVLSQLDTSYFRGLEGQYRFDLSFILKEEHAAAGDHIICARCPPSSGARSVSADIEIAPGRYEVLPMILATRDPRKPTVEDAVKAYVERTPPKLRQIGLNYDIAHAKGYRVETAVEAADENCERKPSGIEKSAESEAEGKCKEPEDQEENGRTEEKEDQASGQVQPQVSEQQNLEPRNLEPRNLEPRNLEPRNLEPRNLEPPNLEPRNLEPRYLEPPILDPYPPSLKPEGPPKSESTSSPWNAVCVVGLRVFFKNNEVTLKLVDPQNTDGAVLNAGEGDNVIKKGESI